MAVNKKISVNPVQKLEAEIAKLKKDLGKARIQEIASLKKQIIAASKTVTTAAGKVKSASVKVGALRKKKKTAATVKQQQPTTNHLQDRQHQEDCPWTINNKQDAAKGSLPAKQETQ